MKNYKLFILAGLFSALLACQSNTSQELSENQSDYKREDMAANQALATKYGVENFSAIDTINFTFNVRPSQEADTISRNWIWIPKKQQVSLKLNGQWVSYNRDTIQSEQFKGIDGAFINDQYWLIYPFRTLWDSGTEISVEKGIMPFSKDSVSTMKVVYTDSAGYTPKDTYKLFMDSDGMIAAWEYYPGSADQPALVTSWEGLETYKGIKIPTKFLNKENGFAIFFSNIEIK